MHKVLKGTGLAAVMAVGLGSAGILQAQADENIASVAAGAGQFETLLAAVGAADMLHTLHDEGPYTVFAPTDEAFQAIPPETLNDLLQPENQEQLQDILGYHIVPEAVTSDQLGEGHHTLETVQGAELQVEVADGEISVDGATVVEADLQASNGVVHAIDEVVMP